MDQPAIENGVIAFVRESNMIEGIYRDPTESEVDETARFVRLTALTVDDVLWLQSVYAPGKPLRDRIGMNVRVGNYVAPMGGRNVQKELVKLVSLYNRASPGYYDDPHQMHVRFEKLHPFMDGNGRTGRALWAWHMSRLRLDPFALSFLHRFYYQTLAAA